MLVETGEARRAPPGSALENAVKTEKKNKIRIYIMAIGILGSMPIAAAVVYHFTGSARYAIIGFFSPIIIYWIWMAWLIMDTQSMIADSKRKFPDLER